MVAGERKNPALRGIHDWRVRNAASVAADGDACRTQARRNSRATRTNSTAYFPDVAKSSVHVIHKNIPRHVVHYRPSKHVSAAYRNRPATRGHFGWRAEENPSELMEIAAIITDVEIVRVEVIEGFGSGTAASVAKNQTEQTRCCRGFTSDIICACGDAGSNKHWGPHCASIAGLPSQYVQDSRPATPALHVGHLRAVKGKRRRSEGTGGNGVGLGVIGK